MYVLLLAVSEVTKCEFVSTSALKNTKILTKMNKKTDFRPFYLKKTKKIDKINQQYNLLIVCVLNMLIRNNVE